MSAPLLVYQTCTACGLPKSVEDFYRSPRQIGPYCKKCHNAKCVDRMRSSPVRRQVQLAAKARWNAAHPQAKRRHEGRAIFAADAPKCFVALEAALAALAGR